jgi:hypothetical protein
MKILSSSGSRRQVLTWGAMGALAIGVTAIFRRSKLPELGSVGISGNGPLAATPPVEPVTLDPSAIVEPNHELYSPLLNTDFTVEFPDSPSLTVRLVEVTPITKITGPKAQYQCFSLFFETSPEQVSEGFIGKVSHPKLKPMDLFLNPVGRPTKGKILLEAAFTERV